MFKATFVFAMQHGVCGLEIDAVAKPDRQASVELTFRVKESENAPFKDFHVSRLVGYSVWSESPLALLLRALHLLRVEWFSVIPEQLIARPVLDLHLSVVHLTSDGLTAAQLASLSLKKIGHDQSYTLAQSLPNKSLFPMQLDAGDAVPLRAALKTLAQVQLEKVDLLRSPTWVQPQQLADENGNDQLLRDQLPHYALVAFDAYRARYGFARGTTDALVPAQHWRDFLAA